MASETVGAARPESLLDAVAGAHSDPDDRYDITQRGRDDLHRAEAHAKLFGPWPKVSEVPLEEGSA